MAWLSFHKRWQMSPGCQHSDENASKFTENGNTGRQYRLQKKQY
jgi:hypothetical protein